MCRGRPWDVAGGGNRSGADTSAMLYLCYFDMRQTAHLLDVEIAREPAKAAGAWIWRCLWLGLVAFGLSVAPVAAQGVKLAPIQFGDRLDSRLLRVMREIYPDLQPSGKATRFKGAANVPNAVDEAAGNPATGDFDLADGHSASAIVNKGGVSHAVVFVGGMVAVAQLAPEFRFEGAIFVQTDPSGPPVVSGVIALAPTTPGVIVLNAHFNSQEGFADYLLLASVGGKLVPVYDGPSLYSASTNDEKCGDKVMTQQLKKLEPLAGSHAGYADLALEVVETVECGGARSSKTYAATLTWDGARKKYVGGTKELSGLSSRPR